MKLTDESRRYKTSYPNHQNDAIAVADLGRTIQKRYQRHRKIECFFAWLQNYRLVLVQFDCFVENYIGFLHLGCLIILLRYYS